jgi:hypothetical protein
MIAAALGTGCQKFAPTHVIEGGDPELASMNALRRYIDCMKPYVKEAKARQSISEVEINTLGWKCAHELRVAADLRDKFWWSSPKSDVHDPKLLSHNRVNRIQWHEQDLAQIFYCDLRDCGPVL